MKISFEHIYKFEHPPARVSPADLAKVRDFLKRELMSALGDSIKQALERIDALEKEVADLKTENTLLKSSAPDDADMASLAELRAKLAPPAQEGNPQQ